MTVAERPYVAGNLEIGAVRPEPHRRTAGRYVLGELLGRGGMAEVFAGRSLGDHGFQKPVAIKRLLPELASDHVFVDRLIDEAKLLVGMAHGNIVSVIDLARDGDDVFLVMEFVDGPSLRQLLKARPPRGLPVGIATFVVQAAAAGLEVAHRRPGGAIIHADISPSNILLTSSGEVKVADFGIARREGGVEGVVEGKWAYMAPEQARGEPLTPRSDVFALGVVLYELICGAHPLGLRVTAGERESQPLRVIPPRIVDPAISIGLETICMRALAFDPAQRYASMQQLIDALVEERFANHWREGAAELAAMIAVHTPPRSTDPRTIAERPIARATDRGNDRVTIATRSLLRDVTPRPSAVAIPQAFPVGTHHDRSMPGLEAPRRSRAVPILGLAAIAGAIAAIAIQMAPQDSLDLPPAPAPRVEPVVSPTKLEPAPPPPPIASPTKSAESIELAAAPAPDEIEMEPVVEQPPTRRATTRAATPAPAPAKKRAEGTLRLNAYPWAWAYVENKKLEAPTKLVLPEGKYTVKLQNPETGKIVVRTVVVQGGKTASTSVNWEDEE